MSAISRYIVVDRYRMTVVNPSTGTVVYHAERADAEQLANALTANPYDGVTLPLRVLELREVTPLPLES